MPLFTDDSVLVRTEEGESAARQPRRVASNRARAALLLLDGSLSVGEMKRRFGESLEVEDALMELLRDGLAVDRDDAVTDHQDDLPAVSPIAEMSEPPTELPVDRHLSLPPGFVATGSGRRGWSSDERREPGIPDGPEDAGEVALDASIAAAYSEKDGPRPAAAGELGQSALSGIAERLRHFFDRLIHSAVTLALVALAGVLAVAVWNAPEWFRTEIESRAVAAAGTPVAIDRLAPAWRNGPAIRLSGLKVGEAESAVTLDGVEVSPDWFALLRHGTLALRVRLNGLEGRPTQLAELFNRADFARLGAQQVGIQDLRLRLTDTLVLSLSGEGEMSAGVLQSLTLREGADGLRFRVAMPLSFPLEFSASANDWRSPFLPAVLLESIQFEGMLSDEGVQVASAGGALHGGRYGGRLELGWNEVMSLQGEFQLDGVRLERLMPAIRPGGDLEGSLTGKLQLKARSQALDGLAGAMELSARVELERGRFGGLDVGAIMRERGTGLVRGGATRFDSMHLDLTMNLRDRVLRAAIRRFDAGNLHVAGSLLIKSDDELSGRLNSSLSAGERVVSLPMVVSGTLAAPALRLAPEANP